MKDPQREVEELRAGVNCATVLEKATPPWLLDRKESSKRCLKYRRGAGEIVIVTHGGAGWWDPNSDAKGDVFRLVQHLEPSLNFGEVRKMLRPLAGVRPDFTPDERARDRRGSSHPDRPKMGAPAAPAALLRRLALPRGQGTDRRGPDRCGAFGRRPRRPARLRLVPASRCRRPRHPRRRPRPDLQGLPDRRQQGPVRLSPRQAVAPEPPGARRGADRRLEPRGDRAPARGHDLRRDRRRHGTRHDRRARGASSRAERFAGRAPRERCRRQSRRRSLRRPPQEIAAISAFRSSASARRSRAATGTTPEGLGPRRTP